jgi:hypothetical protein
MCRSTDVGVIKKLNAEWRLNAVAIEITFCAIALHAAGGSWETSLLVPPKGLLDRKGIIVVAGCRDRSRQVAVCRRLVSLLVTAHEINDSAAMRARFRLSPPPMPRWNIKGPAWREAEAGKRINIPPRG